jgi:hypothetical protein
MPSLSDIANDAKNLLTQIRDNTAATNTRLDTINGTLHSGFNNLGQGLFAIWQVEKQSVSLLEANSQENHTIICWLSIIAEMLCREERTLEQQLQTQRELRDSVGRMESILELVHAREAVEAQRVAELRQSLEKCCPPRVPEPGPCFEPCHLREVQEFTPQGQDWKPQQQDANTRGLK